MVNISKVGFTVISLLFVVAVLFIGIEIGKNYSARNIVTAAVTDIDPFVYCDIHNEKGLTMDDMNSRSDLSDYAATLYIEMAVRNNK